jgi:nucleoside-diphosphate kinase
MATLSEVNFRVIYTEPTTNFARPMILTLWPSVGEVQLFDTGPKKMFLKRTAPPEKISLPHLFLGATVVICARPYKVIDYADGQTRRVVGSARGSALVLVLPEFYASAGQVVQLLQGEGVGIGRLRMVRFSDAEAAAFEALGREGSGGGGGGGASELSRDHMLAIECVGEDIIARTHEAVGPTDPATARAVAPRSVRALLGGADRGSGVVRVSPGVAAAAAEVAFVFERASPYTAVCTHCAALVIKPHAVEAGHVGALLHALLVGGFEVSALRSVALSRGDAGDFLEPYKGVAPEFERWVGELSSGVCVAVEVRGENVVPRLRELAGPVDVAVARVLAPDSLRAKFGVDNVKNAVQVTDVDVDGPLETKFLFTVVA